MPDNERSTHILPTQTSQVTYHLPDEDYVCNEQSYHCVLFGGDQLTVCRSSGAQSAHSDDDMAEERCDGLIPATEDWQARLTLMKIQLLVT